jgi:hypothetical protein
MTSGGPFREWLRAGAAPTVAESWRVFSEAESLGLLFALVMLDALRKPA